MRTMWTKLMALRATRKPSLKMFAIAAVVATAACGGGSASGPTKTSEPSPPPGSASGPTKTSEPSPPPTTSPMTSPVCTSSSGFTYQVGACVRGSGKADIGPFTPPGSWSVSIQLSGQANSADDCTSTEIGMILEAQGAAGREIAAGFGPAMSAHFSAKLAPLHLIFDPSGCSWTATFN
jgi:hypothetical protein